MQSTKSGSWMRVTMVCEARSSSTMPIQSTSEVSFITDRVRLTQPGKATRAAIGRTMWNRSWR